MYVADASGETRVPPGGRSPNLVRVFLPIFIIFRKKATVRLRKKNKVNITKNISFRGGRIGRDRGALRWSLESRGTTAHIQKAPTTTPQL